MVHSWQLASNIEKLMTETNRDQASMDEQEIRELAKVEFLERSFLDRLQHDLKLRHDIAMSILPDHKIGFIRLQLLRDAPELTIPEEEIT